MNYLGTHILIADDDPQVLGYFARILTEGGHHVTAVESGAEVLTVIENQPVDLLVLDLCMPRPDGFDVLKVLKASRRDLKILVVSGFIGGPLLKVSEYLGATASLSKTDAPKLLLQTVNAILATRSACRDSLQGTMMNVPWN